MFTGQGGNVSEVYSSMGLQELDMAERLNGNIFPLQARLLGARGQDNFRGGVRTVTSSILVCPRLDTEDRFVHRQQNLHFQIRKAD